MIAIRLVSAFGLMLVAGTTAQAQSPVAFTPAATVPAGVESAQPKLQLGLSEIKYGLEDGQARTAPQPFRDVAQAQARSPSLAQYLNAPAPYGQLLPQSIDDRGAGYRLWF